MNGMRIEVRSDLISELNRLQRVVATHLVEPYDRGLVRRLRGTDDPSDLPGWIRVVCQSDKGAARIHGDIICARWIGVAFCCEVEGDVHSCQGSCKRCGGAESGG